MLDIKTRIENAERAVDALDEAHIDHHVESLSPESLVSDFLADLMHAHGAEWVKDRLSMAQSHYNAEVSE